MPDPINEKDRIRTIEARSRKTFIVLKFTVLH